LGDVIIKQIMVGGFEVFTYVVACPGTKEAVVIDPAGEEEKILSLIAEQGFRVKYILNTHGHADHVLANERLKRALSVPTCMHELDIQFFSQKEVRELSAAELGLQALCATLWMETFSPVIPCLSEPQAARTLWVDLWTCLLIP
jgi:glyoxylase-like metal-dependent hydrolase (beta-lactamase superfamily II)